MTDRPDQMRRLIEEPSSDFERALLESSANDRSANGACDRALAGLGLGTVAVAATASIAQGGAGATAGTGAGGGASAIAKGGALLAAKWVGIAVLGTAVAVGSVRYAGRASHAGADRPKVATASPPTLAAREGPATVAPTVTAAPPVPATPSEAPAAPSPSARGAFRSAPADVPPSSRGHAATKAESLQAERVPVSPVPAPVASSADVLAEVDALRAIRLTLARGNAALALAQLDAFDAQHARSSMTEEVTVLRIDGLVLAGRRAEASSLAATFLTTYPGSAYGDHVRSKVNSP